MVLLLTHKQAVSAHGGARQSPENRGKRTGLSSVCTRKSTLTASGDSQGLPSALLSFIHLPLVLFLDWELPPLSRLLFEGFHPLWGYPEVFLSGAVTFAQSYIFPFFSKA